MVKIGKNRKRKRDLFNSGRWHVPKRFLKINGVEIAMGTHVRIALAGGGTVTN